jgi:hypothetical protein
MLQEQRRRRTDSHHVAAPTPFRLHRVTAVHASLQLRLKADGSVDPELLARFLRLLGRCRWEAGAAPTLRHPQAVPAPPAPARPGPVVAATSALQDVGWTGGGGDGGAAGGAAGAGGPIFFHPGDPPLPGPLPPQAPDAAALRGAAEALVQRLAWLDTSEAFQPGAPVPYGLSEAAGLPPAVLGARVAEGKLLSGRGDAGAWGRELQRHGGGAGALQELQERVSLVGGRGGPGTGVHQTGLARPATGWAGVGCFACVWIM